MGYKGDSYMDCGYFGISPITGNFEYWPPSGTIEIDGILHVEEKKKIKGFAEYRDITEPFEVSKENENERSIIE